MGKIGQIINVGDTLYEVLGTMKSENADKDGTEVWKKRYNADSVLRNGNTLYFCRMIINAVFEDITK